jgi:hypothetical protein
MAVTITIEEVLNVGSVQGRVFKAETTTSTAETVTAADLGLVEVIAVAPAGGPQNLLWAGVDSATTGTLITYSGVTPSSGTARGLALGR